MDRSAIQYEIRTLKDRRRTSLTMISEYPNDIVAIVMAQKFVRTGEGVEVWRDNTIVYRLEPRTTGKVSRFIARKRPSSLSGLEKWFCYLKSALHRVYGTSRDRHGPAVATKARERVAWTS